MYTSDDMKKKELYPVLWKVFREAPYPDSNIMIGVVLSYLDVSGFDALALRLGGSSQVVSLILELLSVVSSACHDLNVPYCHLDLGLYWNIVLHVQALM